MHKVEKAKANSLSSPEMLLISIWEVDTIDQLYSFVATITSPIWNYLYKSKFYWQLNKARGGRAIKTFWKTRLIVEISIHIHNLCKDILPS